jgi:hypothetical protein
LGVVGVDRDLNTFKIRSLHTSSDNPTTVLIGTKESQLLALDIEVEVARRLVFNHIGEIACLAVHPTLPHFVTGEANLVRAVKGLKSTVDSNGKQVFDDTVEDTHLLHVWDHAERKPLAFSPIKLKHHAYCMAFSADGTVLAIGHEEGKVSLLNYESQSVIVTKKVTSKDESITCLEWSPDGSCLAVGSVDQCIYLCDPRGNDLRVVRKIVGHTVRFFCPLRSFCQHFNFSFAHRRPSWLFLSQPIPELSSQHRVTMNCCFGMLKVALASTVRCVLTWMYPTGTRCWAGRCRASGFTGPTAPMSTLCTFRRRIGRLSPATTRRAFDCIATRACPIKITAPCITGMPRT